MNVPEYVKEHIYAPYFRRRHRVTRTRQILLGIGIGLVVIAAGVAAWYFWSRRANAEDND